MCHAFYSTSSSGMVDNSLGFALFDRRTHGVSALPSSQLSVENSILGTRFWLVAVLGGSLAVFGMVANGLLARLFVSRLNFRHSPFFFLGFVALFDTLLDLVYVLLLTPPIVSEYFNWVHLYLYWLPQARWLYLFGQIFKISSCFCLIVASFERFMMTRHWTFSGFDYRTRWLILGCAIFGAIFVKLLTAVDIVVVLNRNCSRIFQRYSIGQAGKKEWLPSFFSLLTVVLPFGTLVFLNGGIVLMLRHQNVQQLRSLITELTMGHDVMKIRRRNLRAATNTLLVIISAYLISNLLNLFLSIMEYLYPGLLQRTYPYQYRIGSDCASLMTVFGNALRFPAHICSNREISEQLQLMLCPADKEEDKKNHLPAAVTSALTLRRFSERVDNPWFSALLTTPRKNLPGETQPHANGLSKPNLLLDVDYNPQPHLSCQSNGPLTLSTVVGRPPHPIQKPRKALRKPNIFSNCFGNHKSSSLDCDCMSGGGDGNERLVQALGQERGRRSGFGVPRDEENNELLLSPASPDYAYVDETERSRGTSIVATPSRYKNHHHFGASSRGDYAVVLDLRFNPDELMDVTNRGRY